MGPLGSTVILAMSLLIIAYAPWMAVVILLGVAVLYGVIYRSARRRLARAGIERAEGNRDRYQASSEAL